MSTPTSDAIQFSVAAYYHDLLGADEDERFAASSDPACRRCPLERKDSHRSALEGLRACLASFDLSQIAADAAALIEGQQWDVAPRSKPWRDLHLGFLRAKTEAAKRFIERDEGDYSGSPTDTLLIAAIDVHRRLTDAAAASEAAGAGSGGGLSKPGQAAAGDRSAGNGGDERTASEMLDEFWLERKTTNAARTYGDYVTSLRYLDQISGGKPVAQLTEADIRAFKSTLLRAPKNFRQRMNTDNIVEAVALNKNRKLETINPRTIREKYLSNVKTFIGWCANEGRLPSDITRCVNVAAPKGRGGGERRRAAFTQAHLTKILTSPLFARCKNRGRVHEVGADAVRDHRFWAPLIGLFTGMRANEIGQLGVNSFERIGGHVFIRVTATPDAADTDQIERRNKNHPAERLVPVHRKLIDIGLLEYAKDVRRAGHVSLFPEWRRDCQGYHSGTLSKWFNRTFLKPLMLKSKLLCFHSFRHTFKDKVRQAGIDEEDRRILMGHAATNVSEKYGTRTVSEYGIERFQGWAFTDIDVSHIRYRPARVERAVNVLQAA